MAFLLAACTDPGVVQNLLGPMVATALATMVFIIAVSYMAAQLLKRPEYEGFASIEISQLGISAFIFISIFGMSCFASQIADSFAGGDMFDIARGYLDYLIYKVSLPTMLRLQGTLFTAQWIGSISMRFGASVWGVMIPSFPSFIVIEKTIEFILMIIQPFTSSLIVQQAALEFIRGTMLPLVLPAGVVLRIFPPTRDAGAFLIATALGFQVIFPYTYVMHNNIVRGMILATYSNPPNVQDTLRSMGYGSLISVIEETGVYDPSSTLISFTSVSFLLMQALFLPALSMTLTIGFIKGTAKFISQKLG